MPQSQSVADERPWYALAVTGHASVIPAGPWMYRGDPRWARDMPGVPRVWACLDAALSKRFGAHRIAIYGRAEPQGIDHAVRAYAAVREVMYLPLGLDRTVWGEQAAFRRDLELVGRSHGVLWFGPEETDGDPARIAQILGISVQIVPALEHCREVG